MFRFNKSKLLSVLKLHFKHFFLKKSVPNLFVVVFI